MPIQELAPVTLAEVNKSVSEFENQYGLTSADFLNMLTDVPDDDAAEWNYLLLQREAFFVSARATAPVQAFQAVARIQPIIYRHTRIHQFVDTSADNRLPQYDCAA